ncbi:MAG: hypothetical protein B7Y98_11265 [Sphingomonas sp. 32-62-10]|nr:MAG: hypothetical protein B7Y98_11265 [Sphingomonas sp. 32-62-10]
MCCMLAGGSVVQLEIMAGLDSKTTKISDRFPIRVTAPVYVGDRLVIPKDTAGVGEVIHAAKARAMGKAGELLLVARYLTVGDKQVPLRGFRLGGQGNDNTGLALGLSTAVAPLAFVVTGGEKRVLPGMPGIAKIAVDTQLAEFKGAAAADSLRSGATPQPQTETAPTTKSSPQESNK